MNDSRLYKAKNIKEFSSVFSNPYEKILESIDDIIKIFLTKQLTLDEAIIRLQDLTGDYEYTPFQWILYHIMIDDTNFNIANNLLKNNPNTIVYKYFKEPSYGFNLLSDIYEKEIKHLRYIEMRAKLFKISTLYRNENNETCDKQFLPKISSTFFRDHKYTYAIYDSGIITTYNKGEIWDGKLKKYIIPEIHTLKSKRSFSFSFSINNKKFKSIHNLDGSRTILDDEGNSETWYADGSFIIKYKNSKTINVYPDGSYDTMYEDGKILSVDFEGKAVQRNHKINIIFKMLKEIINEKNTRRD